MNITQEQTEAMVKAAEAAMKIMTEKYGEANTAILSGIADIFNFRRAHGECDQMRLLSSGCAQIMAVLSKGTGIDGHYVMADVLILSESRLVAVTVEAGEEPPAEAAPASKLH